MVGDYHGGQELGDGHVPVLPTLLPRLALHLSQGWLCPKGCRLQLDPHQTPGLNPDLQSSHVNLGLQRLPFTACSKPNASRLGAAKSIAAREAPAWSSSCCLGWKEQLCCLCLCVLGLESLEGDNIIHTVPSVSHQGSRLGGRGEL